MRRVISWIALATLPLAGCPSEPDPTAPQVALGPQAPGTGDDVFLQLRAPGFLPDGSVYASHTVRWSADGEGLSELDDAWVLPAEKTTRGVTYTVEVTPQGEEEEAPSATASVTVVNTAPSLGGALLGPLDPQEGSVLSVQASGWTDPDGDTPLVQVQWLVNGAVVAEASGPGEVDLASSFFARGDEVWATVTPDDGVETGAAVESNHVVIGNASPTIEAAHLDPSAGTELDVFSCVADGWVDPDGDPDELRVRWFVNGTPVSTAATLDGTLFDEGQAIWCEARPFDGLVEGPAVLSDVVVIDNAPPSVVGAAVVPATPVASDVLTVEVSGWSDPDPSDVEGYEVTWSVNGVVAGTGASLAGAFARGDSVVAEVVPDDGQDQGVPVTTAAVVVVNSVPVAAGVTLVLEPSPLDGALLLTAVPDGFADADGDPEGWVYAWTVNGQAAGADSAAFATDALQDGDVVTVTATPDDGLVLGAPVTASVEAGPFLVVTPDPLAFGDLEVGCDVTLPLTLQNDGMLPLVLDDVSLTDVGGTGELTLPSPPAQGTEIPPGGSLDVLVAFTVVDATPASADITITSNDPTAPTLSTTATGEAHAAVDPANLVCVPNEAPVAIATVLTSGDQCSQVAITALGSWDPDGDPLTYDWTIESAPAGSVVSEAAFVTAGPDVLLFEPDLPGTWEIGLVAIDAPGAESAPVTASVTIGAGLDPNNQGPTVTLPTPSITTITATCETGPYGPVCPPCAPTLELDASGVTDPDSVNTAKEWGLVGTAGETIAASFDGGTATVLVPTQTATAAGQSTSGTVDVTLTATDCEGLSDAASVTWDWECVWN